MEIENIFEVVDAVGEVHSISKYAFGFQRVNFTINYTFKIKLTVVALKMVKCLFEAM